MVDQKHLSAQHEVLKMIQTFPYDRLEAGRSISGKILRIIFCCCTCKKNKKGKDNNEKNDFSVPIIKQNQIAPARSKEALNRLQELRKEYGAGSTEYKAALEKMHAKKQYHKILLVFVVGDRNLKQILLLDKPQYVKKYFFKTLV